MLAAGDAVIAATALVRVNGRPVGSAVLVEAHYLLTARHVVQTRSTTVYGEVEPPKVTVEFLRRTEHRQPVTVVDLPQGPNVDLAVLKVEDEVFPAVPPVRLWAARHLPERVAVFGFPLGEAVPNGVWRDFAVAGATVSGQRQLAWTEDVGSFEGHSGGPVVDTVTGDLVGVLVTGSVDGRFDRFEPITRAELVWSGLRRPWLYAGEDARAHVRRRGTGQRGHVQRSDRFKGRQRVLDAVSDWLTRNPSPSLPLVITGQPGAGKSSVLARAAMMNERRFPGVGLVFHARSGTAGDLVRAVAAALDVPLTAADGMNGLLEWLSEVEPDAARRLIVMVDALDEVLHAAQRSQIATGLVGMATVPWITVVVATRPLAAGSWFVPGSLLHQLGVTSAQNRNLIDLDSVPYKDPQALYELTRATLTQEAAPNPGPTGCAWEVYRDDPPLASKLARKIAAKAERNFLVAALTSAALSTADEPIDPRRRDFDPSSLPSTVGEALDKYLDSLEPPSERVKVRGLLAALAFARGPGLTDQLWLRFASGLGYQLTQLDLDTLRYSSAADYLLQTSTTEGERLSRLYHQALVDQLLYGRDSHTDRQSILRALRMAAADAGGWNAAPVYLRTYTAEHALDARKLTELLEEPDFVVCSDLTRLVSATAALESRDRTPAAILVQQYGAQAGTQGPKATPFLLALGAANLGFRHQRDAYAAMYSEWRPVWAHGLNQPHQGSEGVQKWVNAVAVGRLGDRHVIVSAGTDRMVRVWDATGVSFGNPLTGHLSPVSAVAVGRLGDRDVVVSAGGTDNSVRVWDAAGASFGDPLTDHLSPVSAVAVGRLGDRDVIVSAGADRAVRVWDDALDPLRDPLTGHQSWVNAVAVGQLGGQDVIVSADSEGAVRVWDVDGAPVGDPVLGHRGGVSSVVVGQLGGQDVIVSAGSDGTVRVWDVDGAPVGDPVTGHRGSVSSVAVGQLGGQDVIVSAGSDRTVRVWDVDGAPLGRPLPMFEKCSSITMAKEGVVLATGTAIVRLQVSRA